MHAPEGRPGHPPEINIHHWKRVIPRGPAVIDLDPMDPSEILKQPPSNEAEDTTEIRQLAGEQPTQLGS